MEKRYQVFVSSTYVDLQKERHEVMQALLEMDCMPAGMELFPAANEEQWSLIKRVIDESDYYIVISGGRYGSLGQGGLSYTEMEYRYAAEIGKPVIAFLHHDLLKIQAGQSEQTEEGRQKLKSFRELMQKRLVKYWATPDDLGSKVSRSLMQLTKQFPGTGWIRADKATLESHAAPEILRLRQKIDELQAKLDEVRLTAPLGSEKLAQGDDEFLVHFDFEAERVLTETWEYQCSITWNQIFFDVGPVLLNGASDGKLRKACNIMVEARSQGGRADDQRLKEYQSFSAFEISEEDFHTIKIQLGALGLVARNPAVRIATDTTTTWILTPLGVQILTGLRAIPKGKLVSELTSERDHLLD